MPACLSSSRVVVSVLGHFPCPRWLSQAQRLTPLGQRLWAWHLVRPLSVTGCVAASVASEAGAAELRSPRVGLGGGLGGGSRMAYS